MIIRRARREDVPAMHQCIVDLAVFEREPDAVAATPQQLERALFDGANTPSGAPALYAHVAEIDGRVVGIAIWFLNYSTWRGTHGIYLEDLYVDPAHRGSGIGGALMGALAAEARERGFERFEWWVLDWNRQAIDVYEALGAEAMSDWTVYRLSGDALQRLAARGSLAEEA